ncbi:aspartic peptidase domain-containing protein [Mycena maculata]|uniref:Aspartic peptidase domain-containing protein n=1 Tax=Mycena maculata TaxID=230809 RepID=A0AAD7J8D1_9AGAR|nr:aspartic peptidase domain-containing protein [Mycena maculata]
MWTFVTLLLMAAITSRSNALVMRGTRFLPRQQNGITLHAIAAQGLDFRYATNLTVNGQDFNVVIDTGSSDIWVIPPADFVFENTGIPVSLLFAGGSANGTVGFGTVELGPYTVDQQVFQNVTSTDIGAIQDLGLTGLLGLSFSGIASPLTIALTENGSDPVLGNPLLFNIFNQTSHDNFIGISLSRTGDLEGTADASFTINEFDPKYAAVANAPTIPVFSGKIPRWRIAVDSISVDGVDVPLPQSNVSTAPAGKLATLLDTGNPTASVPASLISSVFSQIPGALFQVVEGLVIEGQAVTGPLWTVPCNTTTIVSVGMGGQSFPIHPLDLSLVFINNVTNVATCVSEWVATPGTPGDIDMAFGDSFLRNFYTVFNFGDNVVQSPSGSSVQLLSQTNATSAQQDVLRVRTAQLVGTSSTNPSSTPDASSTGQSLAATSPTKQSGQPRVVVSRCIFSFFVIFVFILLRD